MRKNARHIRKRSENTAGAGLFNQTIRVAAFNPKYEVQFSAQAFGTTETLSTTEGTELEEVLSEITFSVLPLNIHQWPQWCSVFQWFNSKFP
jgi:hypothetical protein